LNKFCCASMSLHFYYCIFCWNVEKNKLNAFN